jgi:hypothetical protein
MTRLVAAAGSPSMSRSMSLREGSWPTLSRVPPPVTWLPGKRPSSIFVTFAAVQRAQPGVQGDEQTARHCGMLSGALRRAPDSSRKGSPSRRAGGRPIGVDEHSRPRYRGRFMQHLITIDLDEAPRVRARTGLADARALAVFIGDADDTAYSVSH